MKPDQVYYFVLATLGLSVGSVTYSNQPDTPNALVTVYDEGEIVNVHNTVMAAKYQAIVRVARNTANATGEARARTLLDRIRSLHNRATYDGCYLTGAMSGSSDPVIFAPDDGSGTTKAGTFTANDYILIGSEILKVTSESSPNVTASRAALGTTKAAHSNNDEVKNITQNPIPGELCDSTTSIDGGVLDLGLDDKHRRSWAVNWKVILKT